MENEELELLEDDEQIVVMTDEEGNEYYYREEMIIPCDDKNFALLVAIDGCDCEDEECECHEEHEEEEPDVYIARIDFDEDGEAVYLDPTEEEFEAVKAAYEAMINSSEE
ncbi:MAG TPA: DUF1292 domain-containing protein [Candidatus Avacidaminococcus intestinavium]|uniref:DUF1292 domain-containing protein n=1 Tax=Candidatus Avacidaminococcus intestinavium TaxID=2840684 RepID=A0A9D1SM65_9FIRM|nr:DUF1292 domain-containing protein [Candidatus Avacidaminococcus intestinavium]